MTSETLRDKACGCLLGLASGDALAMPVRGLTPYEVTRRYQYVDGFYEGRDGKPAGSYTGVTQLALTHALCLARTSNPRENGLAKELADKAREGKSRWKPLRAGEKDHSEFVALYAPLGLFASSPPVSDSELLSWCKHVGTMVNRSRPSILGGFAVAWAVKELARNSSVLEHVNDLCLSKKSMMSRLISVVEKIEDHVEKTERIPDRLSSRLRNVVSQIERGCNAREFVGGNGNSWKVSESVPAAFYFFLETPDDFSGVERAASVGGASTIIAGTCGALTGASVGTGFVPEHARDSVEGYAKVVKAGMALASVMERNGP